MPAICFYPGPSKLYPQVEQLLSRAFHSGLLSSNHRSAVFKSYLLEGIPLVKKRLEIPEEYSLFFCTSATECWQILNHAFAQCPSFHFYSGSFGEKWFKGKKAISSSTDGIFFPASEGAPAHFVLEKDCTLACFTHCETSNGSLINLDFLKQIRNQQNDCLIALDATSSMGSLYIPWEQCDFVFASAQKGLGLPAGISLFACSPRGLERALYEDKSSLYASFTNYYTNILKGETPFTPNQLGMFLLIELQKMLPAVQEDFVRVKQNANNLAVVLREQGYALTLGESAYSSPSVFCIRENNPSALLAKALACGISLGAGYGPEKASSFRIANFPQHSESDWQQLFSFLRENPSV